MDILRDSPLGQLSYLLTRNSILRYPDETPGFQISTNYLVDSQLGKCGEEVRANCSSSMRPESDGGTNQPRSHPQPDDIERAFSNAQPQRSFDGLTHVQCRRSAPDEAATEASSPALTADGYVLVG